MKDASSDTEAGADHASVCLCVLMNHPFPKNIPLLRRLYANRFSKIFFLMPFYRSDEEDVLTVYRGSYTHAAYLTDVRERLGSVDCDYYMVIHDDVLLNPQISEASFRSVFPLGPRDGYISHLMSVGSRIGDWTWLFGFAPKALYPKSHVFGGGVEAATLRQYLPKAQDIVEKFRPLGIVPQSYAELASDSMPDVEKHPSRTLLHGYAADIDSNDEDQMAAERHCLAAEVSLVEAMKASARVAKKSAGATNLDDPRVELPIPIVGSSYYADLYILPKTCFDDFVHYIGVASAANFFVELMVPTLLVTCCDRVWTAQALGIDASGFAEPNDQSAFKDPKYLAMHPFKLSGMKTPAQQRQFIGWAQSLHAGMDYPGDIAVPGLHAPERHSIHPYATEGWHSAEDWGRWSRASPALIRFVLEDASITSFEVHLMAPVNERLPIFMASYSVNGNKPVVLRFDETTKSQKIDIPRSRLQAGNNVIELFSNQLVRPCDLDPASPDKRPLGLALLEMKFSV